MKLVVHSRPSGLRASRWAARSKRIEEIVNMKSPIIISLASIIPGLGLWLIGKHRHAIIAAALVIGSLLVFILSPWPSLTGLSFNIALILWIMQGIYAGYEARLVKAIKSGNLQQAKEGIPIVSPPSDINRFEKEAFKAKEIVRQQIEIGETILDAIPAYYMSVLKGAGSYRLYYIGLLKNILAIIDTDFMGKPASIERIKIITIENITIKHGLLTDDLSIFIDPKRTFKVRVTRRLRVHTDNIVETLLKQKVFNHNANAYLPKNEVSKS
jgi:hypothetical protein